MNAADRAYRQELEAWVNAYKTAMASEQAEEAAGAIASKAVIALASENARLKAEVERLTNLVRYWSEKHKTVKEAFERADDRVKETQAELKRLTKLKDAVFAWEDASEWGDFEVHWADFQSQGCNELGANIWRAMLDLGAKFKGFKSWKQMQADGSLEAYLKEDDAYRAAKKQGGHP